MISPASSDKRVSAHSRRALLRQFWFLPAACVLFFLFFLPVSLFSVFGPDADPVLTTGGIYHLFAQDSQPPLALGPAVMGVVSALLLFGFLFRARSAAAYFSLGVSRTRLFRQRFFFGFIGPVIGVPLGVAASFLINAAAEKVNSRLVLGSLSLAALLLLAVLVPYTLCALVCTLCGTLPEGAVYTGLLLGAPHLLAWIAGVLCRTLLPGSPFDASSSPIAPLNWGSGPFSQYLPEYISSLFQRSDVFGPALFAAKPIRELAVIYVRNPGAGYADVYTLPSGWLLLIWTAVIVGAALLAWRLFLRRPGELSGFAGRCRVLGTGAAVLLGLTAFCLPLYLEMSAWAVLPLAALAFALVWGISCLAAFRGFRRIRGSLLTLPISLGTALAISIVLASGGLGFSSRIPTVDEIETAEITYRGNLDFTRLHSASGSGYMSKYISWPLSVDAPEDMETVLSLHRELIAQGRPPVHGAATPYGDTAVREPIALRYTLKNGKSLIRMYDTVTLGFLEKLLELEKTDGFFDEFEYQLPYKLSSSSWSVSLLSPLSPRESGIPLRLSASDAGQLTDCLIADLKAQTLQDRYFPEIPAVAVLDFGDSQNTFPVTQAYTRTLSFLREREMLPEAVVPDFTGATARLLGYSTNDNLYRTGYSSWYVSSERDRDIELPREVIQSLLPTLRTSYLATRPTVQITLRYTAVVEKNDMTGEPGGERTCYLVRFLPLEELPDSLRTQLTAG